jgi:hypothetical protein
MIAGVSKPYNARPRGFPRQYLPPKRAKVELWVDPLVGFVKRLELLKIA